MNLKMIDGKLAEEITFKGGLKGWYFSSKAHKVIFFCQFNGFDYLRQEIFDKYYYSELKSNY
jgi:hypothetical protein